MLTYICVAQLLLCGNIVLAFTDLQITKNTIPIRMHPSSPAKRDVHPASVKTGVYGLPYVDVVVGGQKMSLSLGSGFADLYVFSKNFTCLKPSDDGGAPTTLDQCGDGALDLYHSSELSGGFTTDEHYNLTYIAGDPRMYGRTGIEEVQVANVDIKQKIALVQQGYWNFPGGGGVGRTTDNSETRKPYSTWLFTAISEKKFPPVFSLAFHPSNNIQDLSGVLAFGGLPDVKHDGNWASTPIRKFESVDSLLPVPIKENLKGVPYPDYYYYKIHVDGWTVNGVKVANLAGGPPANYKVECGTSQIYAPEDVLEAIGKGYSPPATIDDTGYWIFNCNATLPEVALTIGGVSFPIGRSSLFSKSDDGTCYLNMPPVKENSTSVLGMDFLKDVVTVYDIGALHMRFAKVVS